MKTLTHELQMIQNPALGAVLLWRFALSYAETHPTNASVALPLAFLPLPILWHEATALNLVSTNVRSGLRAFAAKFSESSPSQLDVLLELNHRTVNWRPKTLASLRVALATGLLRISPNASLLAGSNIWSVDGQADAAKKLCFAAEKLGAWFADISVRELCLILHVRL